MNRKHCKAYISKCLYSFNQRKCNSDQWWNNDKCRRYVCVKTVMYVKKIIFESLLHVIVRIEKYLTSIIDNSATMRDEVIES